MYDADAPLGFDNVAFKMKLAGWVRLVGPGRVKEASLKGVCGRVLGIEMINVPQGMSWEARDWRSVDYPIVGLGRNRWDFARIYRP